MLEHMYCPCAAAVARRAWVSSLPPRSNFMSSQSGVLVPCLHILVVLPPRCPLRFLVLCLFFCQFLAQCLRLVRLFLARLLRWFSRWFVLLALLITQTI